jgi:pimeloyl-ACP methyl ester carboxylesterase
MSGLVLLHGLGLSRRSWDPVLPLLAERHEVLALDIPGFGEAPPIEREPTIAALADAVQDALDRAGVEQVTAAGNSLGGSIALELARRGRVARVVVLGPAGLESPAERYGVIALNEAQRAAYVAAAPFAGLVAGNAVTRAALLGWLHGQPWRMAREDAEQEIRDFAHAPGFHATLRRATGAWRPAELAEIDVPVRICVGTRDVLIGTPNAPRFAAAIPGARIVPLPGCGHVPMPDDPSGVARAISEFAAR